MLSTADLLLFLKHSSGQRSSLKDNLYPSALTHSHRSGLRWSLQKESNSARWMLPATSPGISLLLSSPFKLMSSTSSDCSTGQTTSTRGGRVIPSSSVSAGGKITSNRARVIGKNAGVASTSAGLCGTYCKTFFGASLIKLRGKKGGRLRLNEDETASVRVGDLGGM